MVRLLKLKVLILKYMEERRIREENTEEPQERLKKNITPTSSQVPEIGSKGA